MTDYTLTAAEEPCAVIRTSDGACIPPDMANRDYNGDEMSPGYIQWKEAGNEPDPYVEPEPPEPPPPSDAELLAFDHENRILALEGEPPLTMEDFLVTARGGVEAEEYDEEEEEEEAPAKPRAKKKKAPAKKRK